MTVIQFCQKKERWPSASTNYFGVKWWKSFRKQCKSKFPFDIFRWNVKSSSNSLKSGNKQALSWQQMILFWLFPKNVATILDICIARQEEKVRKGENKFSCLNLIVSINQNTWQKGNVLQFAHSDPSCDHAIRKLLLTRVLHMRPTPFFANSIFFDKCYLEVLLGTPFTECYQDSFHNVDTCLKRIVARLSWIRCSAA